MSYKKAIVFLSIIVLGCTGTNQTARYISDKTSDNFLQQLVLLHPTEDTLQTILVNDAILKQGSTAIIKIGQMLNHEDDQISISALYALGSLNFHVMREGMGIHRNEYLSGIYSVLRTNLDNPQKTRVINLLNFSGDDSSIPFLTEFLNDPVLLDPACQALVAIETSKAGETLLRHLSLVPEKNQPTIIKSLGDIAYDPAKEEIIKLADISNPERQLDVLYAMARLGYPPASTLFETDYSSYSAENQDLIINYYFQWINNLSDSEMATSHLRQIINSKNGQYNQNHKIEAISELFNRKKNQALPDITNFIKNNDQKSRIAALQIITTSYDEQVTNALADLLREESSEIQRDIIYVFGMRHYPPTLSIIKDYLGDKDPGVRISAIDALAGYDKSKIITSQLLKAFADTEFSEERLAIRTALFQIPSEFYLPDMVAQLEGYSSENKIVILEIISERQAEEYLKDITPLLSDDSLSVRISALNTFELLAGKEEYEKILPHFINSLDKNEQKAAADALVAIISDIRKDEEKTDPLIKAYSDSETAQKLAILSLFSRIGGNQALNFVSRETKSENSEIRDIAMRTLAGWSGYEALEPLVNLAAESTNTTYHVLAIRGALQIIGENELGSNYEIDLCKRLMTIARRNEEKILILSAMSAIRSRESLAGVTNYIDDPDLGEDAARAAVVISTPMRDKYNLESDLVAKTIISTLSRKDSDLVDDHSPDIPEGFTTLFNGQDLDGWKGLVENPVKRAKMSEEELETAQIKADSIMHRHWRVLDGLLCFDGKGQSLCTDKNYGNFELLVEWKIEKGGDSGIYLRGSPQVQIWDAEINPVGSGGLYNNQKNPSDPLTKADNPVGEWNRFHIIMIGSKVTVYLNGKLVVDNVLMENYWERDKPIYSKDAIELQAHHSPLYFRNIFIKELPQESETVKGDLFNGKDLTGWELVGAQKDSWNVQDGVLFTEGAGGGWISSTREYSDFILELEYRVPTGGNSGVFIRAPRQGNPAYAGMEIQVLDDYAEKYADLHPWQYTGSIYAVQAPSKRVTKQHDQWQKMKIICDGPRIKVFVNEEKIIDTNLIDHMHKVSSNPGLKRRQGFIGLQNHSTKVEYRNIRIEEINK